MDPGEESFTLSSFDFNSSFALYSSDDDDHHDVDTYIELELRSAASAAQQVAGSDGDDELRISFSAVVPFPGFFPSNSAIIVSSKPSFDQPTPAVDSTPEEVMESTPSPINDYPHINGWDLVRTR